ncbi:E3 ubiquitin-protein ligase TRIM56-like [Montipora capricornis]|uniref:E3 ubiquitin-protein ligase TRIM56-like n=1 Tax=Montipora capricornis TaxID=246305 RepID=UPI0035F1F519
MASESLECSICREKFDDQQHCPRLLPGCGHTFCTNCLQTLLKNNVIYCPTCRSTVSASAGLATLPKNFALLDILLSLPQKGNDDLKLCQICDDEKHPATSCCLDCKEYMCKDVARLHTRQKLARHHCVVSLEELKANPMLVGLSDALCPEHNDQFRFFDEDCGHVVCRECVILKHHGHKCLSLADAASKYRHEMNKLSNKAIALEEKIKASEARLKEATDDLKQQYEITAALFQTTLKETAEATSPYEETTIREESHPTPPPSTLNATLKNFNWFTGRKDREQVQQMLSTKSDGTFLIRESVSRPGGYALSVKFQNRVAHIKIEEAFYLSEGLHFRSIEELVDYYKLNNVSERLQTHLLTVWSE